MTARETLGSYADAAAALAAASNAIQEGRRGVRVLRFSTRDLSLPRPQEIDPAEIEYLVTADLEVSDGD